MRINTYVKDWYDERYNIDNENLYMENARWLVEEPWYKNGVRTGMIYIGICFVYAFLNISNSTVIFDTLLLLAALTVAYFFYAIREYDANDSSCSVIMYFAVLIFLFMLKSHVGILGQMAFIIVGIIMFVVMMIIVPISLLKRKKQMEQIMQDLDTMQEEADKQSYEKFEYEYKSYRNGIPEMNENMSDTAIKEARKLFEGYTTTKEMLKSRFRSLAKKYHPDNGGDEILFQSISFVYDELTSKG